MVCTSFYFLDGTPDQLEKAKASMEAVATLHFEKNKDDCESVLFFYINPQLDNVAECIYEFFDVPNSPPLLLLADVQRDKFYACENKEICAGTVKEFFESCQKNGYIEG